MSGAARKSGEAQTAQVITLLNQLGDRLVRGEDERLAVREEIRTTREMLSDLENRADLAERIFLTIQDNISKKETAAEALEERQARLEEMYRESTLRLQRAESLTTQIEDAIALQNSLSRRLEKTAQDRVQMMGQIEHLETVVEETRKTLNSGALVGISVPQPPANDPLAANRTKWWQAPYRKQAAVFSSLAVAGLLCGVALGQLVIHYPYKPAIMGGAPESNVAGTGTIMPAGSAGDDLVIPAPLQSTDRTDMPSEEGGNLAEAAIFGVMPDDLAPYAEDTFSYAMDVDPEALAATLSAIEPGAADAGDRDMTAMAAEGADHDALAVTPESAPQADQVEIVAVEPAAVEAGPDIDPAIAGFIAAERNTAPLGERIRPDSSLPSIVQAIEAKAFAGIPEAQHDLAAIYTAGHENVTVDYNRAALWFHEAAIHGVANARYNLGVLHHQGLGVERDIAKALEWYRSAAVLGHPEARYNLGIAAIEGIGTDYNPSQAATYFEDAARSGVMEAAYNLGLIHENGLLGDADMNEAIFWYSTAADHNPEARMALNQLVRALGLGKHDVERVVREFGAVYRLDDTKTMPEKAAAPVIVLPDGATDLAASAHDPASLAKVIPPLSVEESRTLMAAMQAQETHALVAQVQEQLIRLGLYPGPADGITGPQTRDAIRSYQSRNALEQTGRASENLLGHLMQRDTDVTGFASR